MADYAEAYALWKASEGIGLSSADEPAGIRSYLERNAGFSFTARHEGRLIGAVLCGHDGRRGFLHHLAVHPEYRQKGVGQVLVEKCHAALRSIGIEKVHIFVYHTNQTALSFWLRVGYKPRDELVLLSADISE